MGGAGEVSGDGEEGGSIARAGTWVEHVRYVAYRRLVEIGVR